MTLSRPRRYPTEDECAAILVAADRTCCVCRLSGRPVQLHHIDDDRSNPAPDNFAVLCLDCHNETLQRGGFGRQLAEPKSGGTATSGTKLLPSG